MVEELAKDYAGQQVVFLEYNVDDSAFGNREWRWWSAFNDNIVALPMVMVDSGNQISNGYEDFDTKYRSMVDASLTRVPQAVITASGQRVGDGFHFDVQVKNTSSMTLSSSNNATVWAIVYEVFDVVGAGRLTNRFVRAVSATSISSALPPGETGSFALDTPALSGVVWSKLRAVVLVDYLPSDSTCAYDMLQVVSVNSLR